MAGLTVYWFTRGYTDDLRIPVHYSMPVRIDWFAGLLGGDGHQTPTEILQRHWCALPCDNSLPFHWYVVLLTTVYSTHFFTGLTIAGVLWVVRRGGVRVLHAALRRDQPRRPCRQFPYPMAPPWLAAQDGYLPDTIRRSSGQGLGRHMATNIDATLTGLSNPVAAMPSLYTGVATTIAVYGIWRLQSRWRWLLLVYPLAMGTALVYFAEHYVVDSSPARYWPAWSPCWSAPTSDDADCRPVRSAPDSAPRAAPRSARAPFGPSSSPERTVTQAPDRRDRLVRHALRLRARDHLGQANGRAARSIRGLRAKARTAPDRRSTDQRASRTDAGAMCGRHDQWAVQAVGRSQDHGYVEPQALSNMSSDPAQTT